MSKVREVCFLISIVCTTVSLYKSNKSFVSSTFSMSGSPVTRWASVAFGAGVGLGTAYTECSSKFDGSSAKLTPPGLADTPVSKVALLILISSVWSSPLPHILTVTFLFFLSVGSSP